MGKAIKQFVKTTKQLRLAAAVVLISLLGAFVVLPTKAANTQATLSLDPATANIQQGQQFGVNIDLDTAGQSVECTTIDLSYDPTALQYVSTDVSGSAFNTQIPPAESGGNGSTDLTRCNLPSAISGSLHIATINFTALANSSDTTVTFKNTSDVSSQGHFLPLTMNGATYTFPTPEPPNTPPPTLPPTPTGSSTPTSSASSSPKSSSSTQSKTMTTTAPTPTTSTPVAQPQVTNSKDITTPLVKKVSKLPGDSFFQKHRSMIIDIASALGVIAIASYIVFTRLHYKYRETNHFPNLATATAGAGSAAGSPPPTKPTTPQASPTQTQTQTPTSNSNELGDYEKQAASSTAPGTIIEPKTAPEIKSDPNQTDV